MIIGLVDYPDLESDWVSVMKAGVPPAMIGLLVAALSALHRPLFARLDRISHTETSSA